MNRFIIIFSVLLPLCAGFAQISLEGEFIFQPDKAKHGHTHASSVVECPNGSLLACWYEGKSDRSTDVHIQAARLLKGHTTWSQDFLLADTPMLSDNNPCLFIDHKDRLWLFYYTLLGSPEEAWDTAFLRYKISTHYQDTSAPIVWDVQNDLPVKPTDLDETVERLCQQALQASKASSRVVRQCDILRTKLKDQLARKLGWTTRAKPVTLSTGAILLPMASEIFGIAMMAITPDGGRTWTFSKPPLGYGIEQPTVFEKTDGTLIAYFRDSSPAHRIRRSESHDHGLTWSPVVSTEFPNPGSGIEVLRLADGNIVLVYNDCVDDPRNSLVVSMSDDEGETWKWTRHIEQVEGEGRFDYPSVIQSHDRRLHVTFSYNLKTIKHVSFTEDWIKTTEEH